MKPLITIVTPIYNRRDKLRNLYNSLRTQTSKNFMWLIIDDGSTDNLYADVKKMKSEATFPIEYVYKTNGGKHTALNLAFKYLFTELTFIVDSDDILLEGAVEEIEAQWTIYSENQSLAGLIFLKGWNSRDVIGTVFKEDNTINNDIKVRYYDRIKGDKAEVWKTDILMKYSFTTFPGEVYLGENYIWDQIALKYNMVYFNKIIYIGSYSENGLTKAGRKLRISCPLGGMANAKIGLIRKFPLRERIKRSWLYIAYGFFAGFELKEIINTSGYKSLIIINLPFGVLIYLFWSIRYGR